MTDFKYSRRLLSLCSSFNKVAQAHGDGLIVEKSIKSVKKFLGYETCAFSWKYIKGNPRHHHFLPSLNISVCVSGKDILDNNTA